VIFVTSKNLVFREYRNMVLKVSQRFVNLTLMQSYIY